MDAFRDLDTAHRRARILLQLRGWLRHLGAERSTEPEEAWLGWDGWVCTDCRR